MLAAQSCRTLCNPMDCSLPGSSIHGISQARILEWVAVSFSRGPSPPRDQTRVSCTAGRFFTIRATREAFDKEEIYLIYSAPFTVSLKEPPAPGLHPEGWRNPGTVREVVSVSSPSECGRQNLLLCQYCHRHTDG